MKLQFTLKRILAATTLMAVSFALMAVIAWDSQKYEAGRDPLFADIAFMLIPIPCGAAVGSIVRGGKGVAIGALIGGVIALYLFGFYLALR